MSSNGKTKFTVFLCLAVILNLCGYLFMYGSWQRILHSPVTREFSDRSFTSFEKEITALLHKATNVHHLSATNVTSLMKKVMKDEFSFENDTEKEISIEGKESMEPEKLGKYKDEKFVTHPRAPLVPKRSGNVEIEKNVSVKENKRDPDQEEKKENILTIEVKKPTVEEQKETDPPSQVKKEKEIVLPQEEQKLEVEKNEMVAQVEEKANKGGALSTVDTRMKGEAEIPVNPHDFNYTINEPSKCKCEDGSDKDVFLLVIILSVHKNFENRNAIRRSWGSPTEIDGHNVITLFLLARISDDKLQKLVLEESEEYHDIIMEDFVDTYQNLTLKTIMGMKWMSTFCAHAKFMMKTDDDMYVSYANIIKYLDQSPNTNFMAGHVMHGGPIRDPRSKWYMPKMTYPGSKYPTFCSGTGYILSGDVPPKIYSTSLSTPYLYLEDVYVAVILDKLLIVPKNHIEFHNWNIPYTLCHFRRILTSHMVAPTEMIRYWNDQTTNKDEC